MIKISKNDPIPANARLIVERHDGIEVHFHNDPEVIAAAAAHSLAAESDRIRGIKAKASAAIIRIAPIWKQQNMLARAMQLSEKERQGESLNGIELAEREKIRRTLARIDEIRFASNQAELSGADPGDFNP